MRMIRTQKYLAGVAALVAFVANAATAQAQGAVITGRVVSDAGMPLQGANAFIPEMNLSVGSNEQGRYTINIPAGRVQGQTVTLRIRSIGFQPVARPLTISAGTQTIDFTLKTDVNRLAEVVVTGVTGATEQKMLPFTVSKVDESSMPVKTSDPLQQLQGKVPGAQIVTSNGRPGAQAAVLLRGPKSINASGRGQGPLYIVDGVIISGGLPDLNAQDIESVEVVKGAAAASLYGSRAGNGVIQITTKRGRETDAGVRFGVRTEYGGGDIENRFPLAQAHTMFMNPSGTRFCVTSAAGTTPCARTVDFAQEARRINEQAPTELSLAPVTFQGDHGIAAAPSKPVQRGIFQIGQWPKRYDAVAQAVTAGQFSNTNVDMTGRFGGANFFASAAHFAQDGAFQFLEGFRRQSVRANIDQQVGDSWRVALTTYYASTREGAGNAAEGGTGFFRLTRVPAGVDLTARDKFGRLYVRSSPLSGGAQNSNPLYLWDAERQTDWSNRFLGGFNARYTPLSWLTLETNAGYDRSAGRQFFFRDRGFRISQSSTTLPGGIVYRWSGSTTAYNASFNASANRQFGDLDTRVLAQYLYEQSDGEGQDLQGINLTVPGLSTASAATSNFAISSGETSVRATGMVAGASATYKERYIVDATFRRDGSSLFGAENRFANYGRGSLAWRVSQEPFWIVPGVNEFKLRASVGTAGGRPTFAAQYETFSIGSGGVLTPATLGNANLRPETTTEEEYGIDAELFNRIGVNVTYAHAVTDDQILQVPPSVATGFTNQWRNAGQLDNKTWEASVNVPIINRRNLTWSTRINYDKFFTKITRLDLAPYFVSANGQQGTESMFWMRPNEQYGTIYGRAFARNCTQLPSTFQGQCGAGLDKAFKINDEGFVVWTGAGNSLGDGIKKNLWQAVLPGSAAPFGVPAGWGNPIVQRDAGGNALLLPLGHALPSFRWSVGNTVTLGKFSAYGLVDASIGQSVFNLGRQWSLGDFQDQEQDQTGRTVETAKPMGHYWRSNVESTLGSGGFYDILGPNNLTTEKASFAKLREVNVAYNFGGLKGVGGDWTLSLTGRNLYTWTNYTGFDPETGRGGGQLGSGALNAVDAFQYPNIRTFTVSIGTRF